MIFVLMILFYKLYFQLIILPGFISDLFIGSSVSHYLRDLWFHFVIPSSNIPFQSVHRLHVYEETVSWAQGLRLLSFLHYFFYFFFIAFL